MIEIPSPIFTKESYKNPYKIPARIKDPEKLSCEAVIDFVLDYLFRGW